MCKNIVTSDRSNKIARNPIPFFVFMKIPFSRILITLLLMHVCLPGTHATHYMGVDITYQCTGPCTYRIYHKAYFDCDGAATTPCRGHRLCPTLLLTELP